MMLQEVREQMQRKERSRDPDALRCSQHATGGRWGGEQREAIPVPDQKGAEEGGTKL